MTTPTDTRSLIMDAFATQLASEGYAGISLVAVAQTAGIRKPSLYHHFPRGKEEIYEAVALRFIDGLRARIDQALSSVDDEPVAGKLEALARVTSEQAAGPVSFEQRIYDAMGNVSDESRAAVSAAYVSGVLDPVARLFDQATASGDLTGDPAFLMNAFLQLARTTDPAGNPVPEARIVHLFLEGARPR